MTLLDHLKIGNSEECCDQINLEALFASFQQKQQFHSKCDESACKFSSDRENEIHHNNIKLETRIAQIEKELAFEREMKNKTQFGLKENGFDNQNPVPSCSVQPKDSCPLQLPPPFGAQQQQSAAQQQPSGQWSTQRGTSVFFSEKTQPIHLEKTKNPIVEVSDRHTNVDLSNNNNSSENNGSFTKRFEGKKMTISDDKQKKNQHFFRENANKTKATASEKINSRMNCSQKTEKATMTTPENRDSSFIRKLASELKLPFMVFISSMIVNNPLTTNAINKYCLRCSDVNPYVQTLVQGLIISLLAYIFFCLTLKQNNPQIPDSKTKTHQAAATRQPVSEDELRGDISQPTILEKSSSVSKPQHPPSRDFPPGFFERI